MRKPLKRAAMAAGATLAGAIIPLTVATSAHATEGQCEGYLKTKGYVIGSGVAAACRTGTQTGVLAGPGGWAGCFSGLVGLRVQNADASEACALARGDG